MMKNNNDSYRSAMLLLLLSGSPAVGAIGLDNPQDDSGAVMIKPLPETAPPTGASGLPVEELRRAKRWCDKAMQVFVANDRSPDLSSVAGRITVFASSGEYSCEKILEAARLRF